MDHEITALKYLKDYNTSFFSHASSKVSNKTKWVKSYVLPPFDGKYPLVTVLFENLKFLSSSNHYTECLLEDGRKSPASVEKFGIYEDRSNKHTISVHCLFESPISGSTVQLYGKISHIHYPKHSLPIGGVSVCVPTFFGKWCDDLRFMTIWMTFYQNYYQIIIGAKKFRIYTNDDVCLRALMNWISKNRLYQLVELKFIARHDAGAHYHNQRLAMFDCFYNSLLDRTDWILFLDTDELIETNGFGIPKVSEDVAALTFASWKYDIILDKFIGRHCTKNIQSTIQLIDPKNDCGGGTSPCCRCSLSRRGRRKYAIKSDYFLGGSPNVIHRPTIRPNSRGKIINLDAASGFYIRHVEIKEFRNSRNKQIPLAKLQKVIDRSIGKNEKKKLEICR